MGGCGWVTVCRWMWVGVGGCIYGERNFSLVRTQVSCVCNTISLEVKLEEAINVFLHVVLLREPRDK